MLRGVYPPSADITWVKTGYSKVNYSPLSQGASRMKVTVAAVLFMPGDSPAHYPLSPKGDSQTTSFCRFFERSYTANVTSSWRAVICGLHGVAIFAAIRELGILIEGDSGLQPTCRPCHRLGSLWGAPHLNIVLAIHLHPLGWSLLAKFQINLS